MVLVSLQIVFYTHFDFEWKYYYDMKMEKKTLGPIFFFVSTFGLELILNSSTIVIVILLLYNNLIRKKREMMICNILHNLVSNFGLFVVCQGK